MVCSATVACLSGVQGEDEAQAGQVSQVAACTQQARGQLFLRKRNRAKLKSRVSEANNQVVVGSGSVYELSCQS